MVHGGMPPWLAILAVLASGAVIGVINGFIVTKLRVNSVIATLGTGTIIVGLNFAYTTGAPIASGVPFSFVDIALGRTLGVPNDIIDHDRRAGGALDPGQPHRSSASRSRRSAAMRRRHGSPASGSIG